MSEFIPKSPETKTVTHEVPFVEIMEEDGTKHVARLMEQTDSEGQDKLMFAEGNIVTGIKFFPISEVRIVRGVRIEKVKIQVPVHNKPIRN